MGALDGRVAIITGSGRGLGREHALLFAQEGAKIVVNDLGGAIDGSGDDRTPAQQVVDEIKAMGGEAVANADNVADWQGGQRLIDTALEAFGDLHILVNNAGILRDRVLVNMSEEEWDAVIHVHLKGHFVPSRFAGAYWRQKSKESGQPVDASIINTSSEAGLYGNAGQLNYAAAKAGIAAMTIVLARELERFGVRANAIAPRARTRMTEFMMGSVDAESAGFDTWAPENAAAMVGWLASDLSKGVTGQVFMVMGGLVQLEQGWRPIAKATSDKPWTIDAIEGVRQQLFAEADPGLPPFLM